MQRHFNISTSIASTYHFRLPLLGNATHEIQPRIQHETLIGGGAKVINHGFAKGDVRIKLTTSMTIQQFDDFFYMLQVYREFILVLDGRDYVGSIANIQNKGGEISFEFIPEAD